jgi:multidrug efflux pump subunit AcrA (membrane-fusion protein)
MELQATKRQSHALQEQLQTETLARQAAEQEQLHLRRAQDALQADLQKARLHATVGCFSVWCFLREQRTPAGSKYELVIKTALFTLVQTSNKSLFLLLVS